MERIFCSWKKVLICSSTGTWTHLACTFSSDIENLQHQTVCRIRRIARGWKEVIWTQTSLGACMQGGVKMKLYLYQVILLWSEANEWFCLRHTEDNISDNKLTKWCNPAEKLLLLCNMKWNFPRFWCNNKQLFLRITVIWFFFVRYLFRGRLDWCISVCWFHKNLNTEP